MAENKHSTSGIGEDILRTIGQLGATELHIKTLIEKAEAELENGMIDTENEEEVNSHLWKIREYMIDLSDIAQLRREAMLSLYELYKGDKDAWCLVKHLAIASTTAFESWQASDNDPELYELALKINKAFVRAVTRFIGAEISDCAACLSDYLKAKGE